LKGPRRRRGEKEKRQESVKGYWTKNLLPFGKNHHFDYMKKSLGKDRYEGILKKYSLL
jgi:hypothetical protein